MIKKRVTNEKICVLCGSSADNPSDKLFTGFVFAKDPQGIQLAKDRLKKSVFNLSAEFQAQIAPKNKG